MYQVNEKKLVEYVQKCQPLKLIPEAEKQYFEVREPFSIWWIVKNPMVLMTVLPLVLVLLASKMPKPDPE